MLTAAGGLRAVGGDAAVMAEQATSGLAGLLRQLRAGAGLTQQELAKAAGVSPRAVSDLERGIHRTARHDTAVRLAGALGLAEPVRSLFVAAARGRIQAAQVLAARRSQAPGESPASAGGADPAAALGHFTAVRDAVAGRPPSPVLAGALVGRAGVLRLMGRAAEAAGDARRALALAREIGDPVGELQALVDLSFAADYAGHHDEAVRPARRAGQITAGIPVSLTRMCSRVLTIVLADAGQLAAAETVGAAALARARTAGDLWNQADLLPRIVDLDLRAGRTGDAAAHLREGLDLAMRTGSWFDWFDLLWGLSQCGSLCAATGRAADAVTLWAACAALERHQGVTDPSWFKPRREEQLRQARQALGPGRARAAEDRGAAMSITTAAEYALLLTDPGPPQPTAPGSGQLSARERELITLVARGRTNAQIAAELYISARTVGSHLDRIRDKTGCRRRADLTRLALSEGLV